MEDEFRIIREQDARIEIEHVPTGSRYLFTVMSLGPDADRTLVHTVEAQGEEPLTKPMDETYGRARAFAEDVMLKAGKIDRANP